MRPNWLIVLPQSFLLMKKQFFFNKTLETVFHKSFTKIKVRNSKKKSDSKELNTNIPIKKYNNSKEGPFFARWAKTVLGQRVKPSAVGPRSA